jgi:hypothetical protein
MRSLMAEGRNEPSMLKDLACRTIQLKYGPAPRTPNRLVQALPTAPTLAMLCSDRVSATGKDGRDQQGASTRNRL